MSGNHDPVQMGNSSARPDAALRKALDALRIGRLDDAQTLARGITEKTPQQEDAWRILAAVAQRQGRLADAAQALKDGIAQIPESAALFTMLGLLLRDVGRNDDAEIALRHALSLQPDQKDAALNLGNMLARAGRLHEAEDVFRKASGALPKEPRFPLQIGRLMLTLGNGALAQQAFEQAVALSREALARNGDKPQDPSLYVEAATHLGALLLSQGERLKALDHFYDAVQLGGDETARRQFADCVSTIPFVAAQPLLKPLLVRALSESWAPPDDLMRQCANQLMLDPDFSAPAERIELIAADAVAPLANPDVAKIAGDPLLRAMLVSGIITDQAFERLLTTLRRFFLRARLDPQAPAARGSDGLVPFAAALSNQCFITEYAYAVSQEEMQQVETLAARIAEAARSGQDIAMADLVALAAYRALHTLDCAQALLDRTWPPSLEPVIERQLREPRKEAALRETITRITPITDDTSTAVRAQYEENPFPRWVQSPVRTRRFALGAWLGELFPHLPPPVPRYADPAAALDVLVAGCGTGQEAMGSATRFLNSELLAVDLSLTSLAYALRKTEEIGLKNITYAQGDILELDGLGRQFDIVECAGVLHHLADPVAGWRILAGLTKPGGYMLMALYSQLGRRDLDPARAMIAERGYGTTAEELRRFRMDVLALPSDHPARSFAIRRDDFYNLSMLRDLVFHVQERRFTIPEISAALDELGLEFCGFAVDPETRLQFLERFGSSANIASLADWNEFENEYPSTFFSMYHFLVRKPG